MTRKEISTSWDRNNRNSQNENFTELYEYKKTADNAIKKSSDAEETSKNAEKKAASVQEQLNQIVVDGDSSVESAQARITADGNTFDTLQQRLNDSDAKFDNLEERYDYSNGLKFDMYPTYYATLEGYRGSAMQSFAVLEDNTMIMTQVGVDNPPGDGEHFTINRLDNRGLLLDKMEIFYGGHSTSVQAYLDGGDIVLMFGTGMDINYKFVRFNYEAGKQFNMKSDPYETLPKQSSSYQTMAIDRENDLIVIVTKVSGKWDKAEFYKMSDYISDEQTTPDYTINGLGEHGVMQGFAVNGNDFYWWAGEYGDANSIVFVVYDVPSGEQTGQYKLPGLGLRPGKTTSEPEGVSIYRNGKGDTSVFVGICVGEGSGRTRELYAWHSGSNEIHFESLKTSRSQTQKLYEPDGYALTLETTPTMLSDLNTPGIYYFESGEWASFADVPLKYRFSGWWVTVYPKSSNGSFRQEATRNTSAAFPIKIGRNIQPDAVHDWYQTSYQSITLWKGTSKGNFSSTFNLSETIKNFEFVFFVADAVGAGTLTKLIKVSDWTDGYVIFETQNIGDSPTSIGFSLYEYRATFNGGLTSFKNDLSTQMVMRANGSMDRINEVSDIGLKEIVGIRM